jgi:hypothetical protein
MTRRKFILAIGSFAFSAKLASLVPFASSLKLPSNDGIVMRNGWILKETDL